MSKIIEPYIAEAKKLASGEKITVVGNTIKTRKHLVFTADISNLGGGKLVLGHGYRISNSSWLEIDDVDVRAYSFYSYNDPPCHLLNKEPEPHGIEIKDFITVNIDVNHSGEGTVVTVMSAGGMYQTKIPGWCGQDGDIFAFFESSDAENCRLIWSCDDLARRIWLIGDSYIGFGYPARWPYFLYQNGYDNALITGYAGMNSQRGIIEFRKYVEKATPEFAVWCLGMNNGDPKDQDEVVEENYKKATEEFLAICKEKGITPVLSTIPNTPKINNRAKNKWVRSLPYRYVDFARAVGSDKIEGWYPEMIYQDNVHPANNGGAALYMQFLIDFPEIMQRV